MKKMEKSEFDLEMQIIIEEYNKKRYELIKKYCDKNSKYKIGDIFKDHIGLIRIEEVKYLNTLFNPSCVFYGCELNKDGSNKKNQKTRVAFQQNEVKS